MDNILNTFINNNITFYIKSFINNDPEHGEILDPLCCMIKLALLSIKPNNTKISITNNKIIFQEPNIIQSAIRWKNGDKREHIHNLYNPINKFLLWYDLKDEKILYILKIAQQGLQKLLQCYNNTNSVTVHSLEYYINLINKAINNINEIDNEISSSDIYYIKFKALWNEEQIIIIYNLLIEIIKLNENNNEQKNIFINSLEQIINDKETIVYNIVNKIATSL